MKAIHYKLLLVFLSGLPILCAQTLIDLRTQTKSVDFSGALSTKPSQTGSSLPAACSVGAMFFNIAAPAGQNLYGCTATNTWTLLGSSLLFGGGTVTSGDCAQFNSTGKVVDAGAPCGTPNAVTMASPFSAAGSLLVSSGPGRTGVASLCSNSGATLTCPGGFTGYVTWPAGSGSNSRQILAPTGAFTNSFTYVWADAVPSAATLMKIGTPGGGTAPLGPAIPDTDYVTPSGTGTLQNKTFDGTSLLSSYLGWQQISTPSSPAAGYLRVYAKTGAGVCWMNSAGTETCPGTGVGDPGGSGLLVETSPGVTANRTLTAGSSNISVTNATGAGGNPTVDIGSTVNFAGKTTSPVQVGVLAGIPASCSAGQMYFATDGVSGRQLQTCNSAGSWVPVAYSQGTVNPATCTIGQTYFNTSAAAGQNLYACTATNAWTPMAGAITSIFGRTGIVTAQTGDYTYAQIANAPASLPPNGAASGDLSGSYPNPVVLQVNGAALPTSGVLKANANHQIVQATAGSDYAPATTGTALLKANGAGGFSAATVGADYMGIGTALQASQMPALTGDCTSTAGSTATICLKANGTALAPSATIDATNAGNITAGTLNAARLPSTVLETNQSNTISGGTQDFHAAAHTLPEVTGLSTNLPGTCTIGEVFFATNVTAGQNQFYCTAANVWTQQTAGLTGAASGDLSGSYPNPKVSQVNGAAIPTGGMLKANASGQMVAAAASDVVSLFSGCSGTQYLGADGACHTASGGGGGSGSVALTTGSGAPGINCTAPSSSNLSLYLDTTNNDEWWCYATDSWKKTLSVTGSGPYVATGTTGTAPSAPASGMVTCYFDSTLNTQVCLDSSANAWQMVKETTVADVQTRSCDISVGDASSSNTVTNAQLGPQKHICKLSAASTLLEVDIESDAGSPSVVLGRRRCTTFTGGTCSAETVTSLVTSALAASSGYMGCSNGAGTAGIDGGTTCAATLQNTGLNAGDWIELVSGTAGGTAKLVTVHVVYTVK